MSPNAPRLIFNGNATLQPRFIEADIYDLPADVGVFDVALITIGVLNWMPDLDRFFEIVAGLLGAGGQVLVYETHPVMEMFDPASATPHQPAFSYFRAEPLIDEGLITYDGIDHGTGPAGYWFIHPLGKIVMACVRAGLAIRCLKEFGYSIREPQYDIYEGQAAQIPMSFLLHAAKA
jgi:SAM-dependent methyltransferase